MQLEWRRALADHAGALQVWVCTNPERQQYERGRGNYHPRPWEHEVQSHFRSLRPPLPQEEFLLVGTDAKGIAGLAHLTYNHDEGLFLIMAVGRALRVRGMGVGRAVLEAALHIVASNKSRLGLDCGVFTRIDPRNDASRALFGACGFEYLQLQNGYQVWVHMPEPNNQDAPLRP